MEMMKKLANRNKKSAVIAKGKAAKGVSLFLVKTSLTNNNHSAIFRKRNTSNLVIKKFSGEIKVLSIPVPRNGLKDLL